MFRGVRTGYNAVTPMPNNATTPASIMPLGHAARPDDLAGPIYIETDFGRWLVEPWNAASAALFLLVTGYWLWRLRGRYREHAFLTACLPFIAIGGIGGTVYHAFRGHPVWLFMDWMPIAILCIATAVYLWARLLRRWWYSLLIIPGLFGFWTLLFGVLGGTGRRDLAIGINYSVLAAVIGLPALGVLWKTGWRNAHLPALAVLFFALAVTSRQLDSLAVSTDRTWMTRWLPMGTHFLWHVFGAGAAHCVAAFLFRLPPARARESRSPAIAFDRPDG